MDELPKNDLRLTSSASRTNVNALCKALCRPRLILDCRAFILCNVMCVYDRMKPKPKPKPKSRWLGETFVGSTLFSDLKTSIADPSVFTVPSFCQKKSNTLFFDEMEDELPTVLERFLAM